ncbi:TrmH family RNA methyltransferase [Pseudoalteromonas fenneropenaei]|uniref:TrmH family RNA methyltransferase n=1 Tax=Pseudoalteromonas fenneropenaei TaxID=1737459 RepID=A0ABV7CJ82_9GAMM
MAQSAPKRSHSSVQSAKKPSRQSHSNAKSSESPWSQNKRPQVAAERRDDRARSAQPQPEKAVRASGDYSSESRAKQKVQNGAELKLYGINSCLAFFEAHPALMVRAYVTEQAAKSKFKALLKWFVANKKAYHVVSDAELEKVTESKHHEGICLLVKAPPQQRLDNWLRQLPTEQQGMVLLLDRVGNPHNLGAIMRVAAHYDVLALVTCDPQALQSGAAVRTSEGGAIHMPILQTDEMALAVVQLQRAGFCVMATSSYHSQDVYRTTLPARAAFILGEEREGVDPQLAKISDKNVIIQGSGKVESLNVSVAAALLCSEFWRQHKL